MRALSLVLDEFYKNLRTVGVSAMTGEGMEDLFEAVARARKEYEQDYLPDLNKKKAARAEEDKRRREAELKKLREDMKEQQGTASGNQVVMDMNQDFKPSAGNEGRAGIDDDDEPDSDDDDDAL